ncbi:MAG: prepilin-type N-terminal cleavage/methylation domain-containing protein [Pseudomonadota bacterium]|nr:prepilin-type N-terminal cleavage/methylation domain-containing protein [Pseudomonadota bacterium]
MQFSQSHLFRNHINNRFSKNHGFTMTELVISIAVLLVLSFAVYKGMRIGSRELKAHIGMKQAQSLVNILQVDLELAEAEADITSLADFFGYLYSRNWPLEENSLFFNSTNLLLDTDDDGEDVLNIDNNGCLQSDSKFQPCWSNQDGLIVKYTINATTFEYRPVYGEGQLASLSADVKMVQNYYFQQTTPIAYDLTPDDTDESDDNSGNGNGQGSGGGTGGDTTVVSDVEESTNDVIDLSGGDTSSDGTTEGSNTD